MPILAELKATLRLAGPLIAAFAGNQMLSMTDTIVAGHLGAVEIAACGIGGSIFFFGIILPMGLVMGLDPLVAQALGAGQPGVARTRLSEALRLASALSVPAMAIMALVYYALIPLVGTDDETRRAVGAYLLGRAPGTAAFLLYVAQRGYLQAVGKGPAIMWAMVVANLVNIPLDLALGRGDAALIEMGLPAIGLPALGVLGIGVASTVVATAQMAVLWWTLRVAATPLAAPPSRSGALDIVRIGWPIGLHFAGEMGIFTVVTVLAGGMGPVAAGGHQVALSLASFTFTVCLGISSATTVRVGSAVGAGSRDAAKRAGLVGIGVAAAFMSATAIAFAVIPERLAGLIAQDAVVEAAVPLLYIAAVFQVFDGLQATAAGALRGASDTRVPMMVSLAGYWLLGLPVGAGLAYGLGWGPAGLWWGLTAGLGVVGVALTRRFIRGAGALAPRGARSGGPPGGSIGHG